MKTAAKAAAAALVLFVSATLETHAENLKGRWQFGGGLSFVSTQDDIRSNAAIINFIQPGPDNIPNTGDETIVGFDVRNDDTVSRETTLQEGPRFDLNFSYGVTDWMSLQVDTGYYDANVVQFDTFTSEATLADLNGDGIILTGEARTFQQSQPIVAGSVTQIPLTLSAVFRFLRDSPVNPYFALGGGYIFTDTEHSDDLLQLDARLRLADSTGNGISRKSSPFNVICEGNGCAPFSGIRLEVEDGTQWQLAAGLEYFVNSKLSIYFDARYNFISQEVRVNVDGYDQVAFLFDSPGDQLPFCDSAAFDSFAFPPGFNRDTMGLPGVCRPGTGTRLQDSLLVQGGSFDMTAFNVAIGVRWAF